jgi:NAD(P)-dependent dehydrogenase (short-subunit alcohol dehydrogenase family)
MVSSRPLLTLSFLLATLSTITNALLPPRAIVVTGANKGQGFALCQRILEEHEDTYVFLCSRDAVNGANAVKQLSSDRVQAVTLDVTDVASVKAAAQQIQTSLGDDQKLYGCVSNAGILWGYSLKDQFEVNARGVRNVLDAFLPLVSGRMIVVSSGLGPLMHSYASDDNKATLNNENLEWSDLEGLMSKCLTAEGPSGFEEIGFPGGAFAEAVPDFHMYGLAKMMADCYMAFLGKKHPELLINSVDPGLVYTDLILKMPKYDGQSIEESGAQTPKQGVEAAMRLLFDEDIEGSGHFYAMNKAKDGLLKSTIDVKPGA